MSIIAESFLSSFIMEKENKKKDIVLSACCAAISVSLLYELVIGWRYTLPLLGSCKSKKATTHELSHFINIYCNFVQSKLFISFFFLKNNFIISFIKHITKFINKLIFHFTRIDSSARKLFTTCDVVVL